MNLRKHVMVFCSLAGAAAVPIPLANAISQTTTTVEARPFTGDAGRLDANNIRESIFKIREMYRLKANAAEDGSAIQNLSREDASLFAQIERAIMYMPPDRVLDAEGEGSTTVADCIERYNASLNEEGRPTYDSDRTVMRINLYRFGYHPSGRHSRAGAPESQLDVYFHRALAPIMKSIVDIPLSFGEGRTAFMLRGNYQWSSIKGHKYESREEYESNLVKRKMAESAESYYERQLGYRYATTLRYQYGQSAESALSLYSEKKGRDIEKQSGEFEKAVPLLPVPKQSVMLLDAKNTTPGGIFTTGNDKHYRGVAIDKKTWDKGWVRSRIERIPEPDEYGRWYWELAAYYNRIFLEFGPMKALLTGPDGGGTFDNFVEWSSKKFKTGFLLSMLLGNYRNEAARLRSSRAYAHSEHTFWDRRPWDNTLIGELLEMIKIPETNRKTSFLDFAKNFEYELSSMRGFEILGAMWDLRSYLMSLIVTYPHAVSQALAKNPSNPPLNAPSRLIAVLNDAFDMFFTYADWLSDTWQKAYQNKISEHELGISTRKDRYPTILASQIRKYGWNTLGSPLQYVLKNMGTSRTIGENTTDALAQSKRLVALAMYTNLMHHYTDEYLQALEYNSKNVYGTPRSVKGGRLAGKPGKQTRSSHETVHDWKRLHPRFHLLWGDEQHYTYPWNDGNYPVSLINKVPDIASLGSFIETAIHYAPRAAKLAKYLVSWMSTVFQGTTYDGDKASVQALESLSANMASQYMSEWNTVRDRYIRNADEVYRVGGNAQPGAYYPYYPERLHSYISQSSGRWFGQYRLKPAFKFINQTGGREGSWFSGLSDAPEAIEKYPEWAKVTDTSVDALIDAGTALAEKWTAVVGVVLSTFVKFFAGIFPEESIEYYANETEAYGKKYTWVGAYEYRKKIFGITISYRNFDFEGAKHLAPPLMIVKEKTSDDIFLYYSNWKRAGGYTNKDDLLDDAYAEIVNTLNEFPLVGPLRIF